MATLYANQDGLFQIKVRGSRHLTRHTTPQPYAVRLFGRSHDDHDFTMLAQFEVDLAQFAGRLHGADVPLVVQMRFAKSRVTSRLQGRVTVSAPLTVRTARHRYYWLRFVMSCPPPPSGHACEKLHNPHAIHHMSHHLTTNLQVNGSSVYTTSSDIPEAIAPKTLPPPTDPTPCPPPDSPVEGGTPLGPRNSTSATSASSGRISPGRGASDSPRQSRFGREAASMAAVVAAEVRESRN